ncbi:hypothetical protein CALCODRAFT_495078 [Calocera cornea HHB12733]|uniref:Uncharacterized protein n=1 Tax=Calocera cornea HHB12733 TaxID=1353952 RepID=A0A165GQG0_9BASI|nr:hypothetical protein CALCODRAFT_495078 [Calocera cornea HHB12733]
MPQMGYPAGYGAQAGGQAQYGPGGPQAPMGQAQWQQQQTYQGNPAGGVGRGFAPVQGGYTQQPLQFPQQGGGRGAHPGQPGQPGYPFQNTHFPGPPYFPGEGGNGANHYNGNH